MNKYEVWFGAIRPDEGVHTGRIYRVTGYEPMLIKYQHIHTLLSFRQLFHAQKAARAAHGNALSERWGGGQVHEYNNNSAS